MLDTLPTKIVTRIDSAALIDRLQRGPMLLPKLSEAQYFSIYQCLQRSGLRSSCCTRHMVGVDGAPSEVSELRIAR